VWQNVLQVCNYVGINVSLYPVVTVAYNLLPDLAFSDLGTDGPPVLCSKGVLALVRIKLDYRIENCKIKTPDLDPCCARGSCDWRRFRGFVLRVWWCNER
jgi:hypothetical protein